MVLMGTDSTQIVVIGGDAAGASAASQIKRAQTGWDVIMIDRGQFTSYSACGLPYWAAGQVALESQLIARSPEKHRENGIDVRMGHEAVALDIEAQTVTVVANGQESDLTYDELVIASGARPVVPPLAGVDAPNVFGVHTIPDVRALLADMSEHKPTRAVVVGAGYIGVEMAEAFIDHGLHTTVIDAAALPMTSLDDDMSQTVAEQMAAQGIECHFGQALTAIEVGADGRARQVVTQGGTYPADIVVLALGVRPNTGFLASSGLPTGASGGLLTDRRQRVLGQDRIWAAGDCVDTYHRLKRRDVNVPLGTHANKQGRVLGTNLAGGYLTFPGVIGTAVTKVGSTTIGRTGLSTHEAAESGFETVSARVNTSVLAGYMPGSGTMTLKLVAERDTGRLLGGQIVGDHLMAAKRIDTVAMGVWSEMTAEELTSADLSYAPPFSPVWDPVQVASRRLISILNS